MREQTIRDLEETKKHMKNYINSEESTKELREMCECCEGYCGKEHDYDECENKNCFKFWLAYKCLEWENSYR